MLEQKELVLILLIVRATADEGEGLRECARRGADPRENGEEGEGKPASFPRRHSPSLSDMQHRSETLGLRL